MIETPVSSEEEDGGNKTPQFFSPVKSRISQIFRDVEKNLPTLDQFSTTAENFSDGEVPLFERKNINSLIKSSVIGESDICERFDSSDEYDSESDVNNASANIAASSMIDSQGDTSVSASSLPADEVSAVESLSSSTEHLAYFDDQNIVLDSSAVSDIDLDAVLHQISHGSGDVACSFYDPPENDIDRAENEADREVHRNLMAELVRLMRQSSNLDRSYRDIDLDTGRYLQTTDDPTVLSKQVKNKENEKIAKLMSTGTTYENQDDYEHNIVTLRQTETIFIDLRPSVADSSRPIDEPPSTSTQRATSPEPYARSIQRILKLTNLEDENKIVADMESRSSDSDEDEIDSWVALRERFKNSKKTQFLYS